MNRSTSPATIRSASAASLLALAALWMAAVAAIVPNAQATLALQLTGGGSTDTEIVSNVCLHAAAGAAPSPFLPHGPFTATWTGTIHVDLRGDYEFHTESSAPFRLEINGNAVSPADASNPNTAGTTNASWSGPVRLRKGTNNLVAVLEHRGTNQAFARLSWRGRGVPPGPIPPALLEPPTDEPLVQALNVADARRRGRSLFLEHRCGRCHAVDATQPVPELAMDAPRFDDMGSMRTRSWMARWIQDPAAARARATMPRMVHGPTAAADAEAMATWLSTLQPAAIPIVPPGNAAIGKSLSETLRCAACHVRPGDPADAQKISLDGIAERFNQPASNLALFLRKPSARFAWSRMPEFPLTAEEAAHLAAWLLSSAAPGATTNTANATINASATNPAPSPELVARGRKLVEDSGCLACHTGPATNLAKAKPLRELRAESWSGGCVGETNSASAPGSHPVYPLSPRDREDLRVFAATDRSSLGRHVPAEFTARWSVGLRCAGCHEGVEGLPGLVYAGEKLKPEWTTRLLLGEVVPKTRTWLPARMPAFAAFAEKFAEGLAARAGFGRATPVEPPIDEAAAADGRKLASASGGLACVTCHAIGAFSASAVFEAPGINFARIGERLRPEYFTRWVRNPQLIDPTTKMPLYFDEDGNSALADFYGGDGPKTLHALWEYIRKGPEIPPPPP